MADLTNEATPPAKGNTGDGPDAPMQPPAAAEAGREDGWPTFTDLLKPINRGLDAIRDGSRALGAALTVAAAIRELHSSLDRFHDPFLEPGSVNLAKDLGQAILAGDHKTVQSLLDKHKGTELWTSALEHLDEECERNGVFVDWDEKNSKLQLLRPPSIFLRGPEGVALDFKAGAEGPTVSSVTNKGGEIPKGHVGPWWDIKQVDRDAGEAARDLGKTMVDRLRTHMKGIDSARKTVDLSNALDLMQPDGQPPEPDEATELVKSLLDKNIAPLVRAVRVTTNGDELEALAEELNDRLEAIGLFCKPTKDNKGIELGCAAKGASDGWAVEISRDRKASPAGFTGNNEEWQANKSLQRNLLFVPPKETKEVSAQRALREILDRVAFEAQRHIY